MNSKNYKKHQIKIFSIKSKILEKEINKSLKQYADFKSNVFLKQHKEKEIHKQKRCVSNAPEVLYVFMCYC